jgi:hypothetical protein
VVWVIPVSSTAGFTKEEPTDTCTRYDVAPLDAFQLSVGFVETVAPFNGASSVGGAGGGGIVVNDQVGDQLLVPAMFAAFTRQ